MDSHGVGQGESFGAVVGVRAEHREDALADALAPGPAMGAQCRRERYGSRPTHRERSRRPQQIFARHGEGSRLHERRLAAAALQFECPQTSDHSTDITVRGAVAKAIGVATSSPAADVKATRAAPTFDLSRVTEATLGPVVDEGIAARGGPHAVIVPAFAVRPRHVAAKGPAPESHFGVVRAAIGAE